MFILVKDSKMSGDLIENRDTRQRIIDASIQLFSQKGYTGASTREIAKIAKVNIASLNYHFRSKQNLLQEVSAWVIDDFENKLIELAKSEVKTAADYTVLVFNSLIDDELRCLNHFKLYLDAENCPKEFGPQPVGYLQLNSYLSKEVKAIVPNAERLWLTSVIYGYIHHMAVLHSSPLGKMHIHRYMPEKQATVAKYLHQLVETLIRDVNQRYA
jgi:AcrR family transcriptional regulator